MDVYYEKGNKGDNTLPCWLHFMYVLQLSSTRSYDVTPGCEHESEMKNGFDNRQLTLANNIVL